jgi:hypothetical protein
MISLKLNDAKLETVKGLQYVLFIAALKSFLQPRLASGGQNFIAADTRCSQESEAPEAGGTRNAQERRHGG